MDSAQVKLMIADTTLQIDSSLSDTLLKAIEIDSVLNIDSNKVLIDDTNTSMFYVVDDTNRYINKQKLEEIFLESTIVCGGMGVTYEEETSWEDLILQKHPLRVNKFLELVNEFYYIPIENKKIKTEININPKTKFATDEKKTEKNHAIKEKIVAVLPSKKRKRRKK